MSEYADILIKNLSLYSFRNYLDSRVVSLFFSEKDLCIIPNCKSDPDDEDSEFFTRYMYKTNVLHAKERLDAMGFGLKL